MTHLRLLLLITLACLTNALVLAQYSAYNYGFDITKRVKRQLSQRSAMVVNDKSGSGNVIVRQEIRQLEKDQDLWTLYILGLSMLQFTDQSSPTSYYGLAGIHGIPHETWGGVKPVPGSEDTGYCTHSSVLFPTWHRPYMALYEQVLHGVIQTIATFWPEPTRQRYEAAARRFRHPYWDWAAPPPLGESVLPRSIGGSQFIDVNGPSGLQRIANPLFSYNFRTLDSTAFSSPWNTWTRTLRSPSSSGPDAQSNNSMVAMNLDQNRASIAQRLYALFSGYDNYTTFSNNAAGPQADSIESIHDTIHSIVGGMGPGQHSTQPGHMAYIQWSAFDPVFFLHHCMVDRILAIWQTLHPNAWIPPSAALLNSYTTRRGQTITSGTALTPFFSHDNGTFWTSDGVRDHTKFGYTYAELVRAPAIANNNMAQVRSAKQAVNRIYGSFSPANLFLEELRAHGIKTSHKTTTKRRTSLPRSVMGSKLFVGDRYHEWTANVLVSNQALDAASSINFFLGGDVPRDPHDWMSAPSHVGTMGVFAAAGHSSSPGQPAMGHGVLVSGTVPLTAALVKKVAEGELASLEPRDVEPYLRENLKKVVLGPKGEVVGAGGGADQECVGGMKIQVVSSVVAAPWSEEELPAWGEAKVVLEMC